MAEHPHSPGSDNPVPIELSVRRTCVLRHGRNANTLHLAGRRGPLILLHGWSASGWSNWRVPRTAGLLDNGFHVIIPAHRAHGKSDKPVVPEAYGIEMVEDVGRLMDELGIPSAHIASTTWYLIQACILLRHRVRVNILPLSRHQSRNGPTTPVWVQHSKRTTPQRRAKQPPVAPTKTNTNRQKVAANQ